jgi:biopolymer transport protein ExbD
MQFKRKPTTEPEINLIPFIDVLLVVLIFLMLSTTYSKLTEMQINLPIANADTPTVRPNEIVVTITSDGRFSVNHQAITTKDIAGLSRALSDAATNMEHPMVIISADAQATHQSVMMAMEAARRSSLNQLTFAAQSNSSEP